MLMKRKKSLGCSLPIMLILFMGLYLFFSHTYVGVHLMMNTITENRTHVNNTQFHIYYKDFCNIVDVVLEHKDEIDEKEFFLSVSYHNGVVTLFDYDYGYIKLSKEEQRSLKNVADSFDNDGYLDCIRVYENGIAFDTMQDRYSLVYTFNSSKPDFINWENHKLKIKKIRKGWYHVTGNYIGPY